MPKNTRKCKVCKTVFVKQKPLQSVCSMTCAIEQANKQREKAEKAKALRDKREHKAKLNAIKPWQDWFDECKTLAQKYARLRDKHDGCISCDKSANWHGQWHGSHFRPAGNYKAVALNLNNIHKSCSVCNNFKSGNLTEYETRLIKKIGIEKVEWLKSQNQPHRHSIEYLQRYKKIMSKKILKLKEKML